MAEQIFNPYCGPLKADEIATGMNLAQQNAERLSLAAEVLLDAGFHAVATSVAALAIEEAGKPRILRFLSTATDAADVKARWKDFRDHQVKNAAWMIDELIANGANKLSDFAPLYDPKAEHPALLDEIKQIGLYVACVGDRHWIYPETAIDPEYAASIVEKSKILARGKQEVTVKEIELWIEHVGPTVKGSPKEMTDGVIAWFAAMQADGLNNDASDGMAKFVGDFHGVGS